MIDIEIDSSKINFLSMLASWFSAVGTIFVGVIALWLARRVEKLNLRVWVGFRVFTGNMEEFCIFQVTNLSERLVRITNIGWRAGRQKKNRFYAFQLLDESSPDRIPIKLEYSDSAIFFTKLKNDDISIKGFVKEVISDQPIDSLKAEFHTSVGNTVRIKPEKRFLELLKSTPSESSKG